METKDKTYEIRRGRTEIDILHRGSLMTVVYQTFGPNTYAHVQREIEQAGLTPPTMAKTASLVHQAFLDDQGKEPEFNAIKRIMKQKLLWAFTDTLYVPRKGAYVQNHPEIRDDLPFMDESDLVKKLEANDPSVRFVPFGFAINSMTSRELEKNPYVIALAGEEGAEKLAEVADKHTENPCLWSFKSVDQPVIRVSALDSGWGLGRGLGVDGSYLGGYRDGCAFGVQEKTGEASRAEK